MPDTQAAASELILILDFGGQYTQLIARRVRECKVYCEIIPCDTPVEQIKWRQPQGLILSGGPASVYVSDAPKCSPDVYELGIPVLGICYGAQLMAHQLGGRVTPAQHSEYGRAELEILDTETLFASLGDRITCWMSHGDLIEQLPEGFRVTGRTANTKTAAMCEPAKKLFGVQFHPEVVHTPCGLDILKSFLYEQCGLSGSWTMASFIESAVEAIRAQVGPDRVVSVSYTHLRAHET